MSWQTYVDVNLVGSGKVSKAAILGQKGGVWASSPEYALSNEEQQAVLDAFSDSVATQSSGIRLANEKFITLQADHRSIYLKKGADGAVLVKTKQAVLVAEFVAPIQAPQAIQTVEAVADYLIAAHY